MPLFLGLPLFIDEGDPFVDLNTGMSGLLEPLANMVEIAAGLGALIGLVVVCYDMFQGERDAANKAIMWTVGLVLVFLLIAILKKIYAV